MIIGMSGGFGLSGVACFSMLVEISTIFLNYRGMFLKSEMSSPLSMVNQLTFFFTYTIFRIFLFPVFTYKLVLSLYYSWDLLNTARRICGIFAFGMYTWMWALNLIWYKLILTGVAKMLGIISKSSDYKRVE